MSKGFEIIVKSRNSISEFEVDSIVNILRKNDTEFEPALSSRYKTESGGQDAATQYFLSKLKDDTHFFITYLNDMVVAFMIVNELFSSYFNQTIGEINTTCVDPNYRSYGLGVMLYEFADLIVPNLYNVNIVSRNTWSTHIRQIDRYERFGYQEYYREPKPGMDNVDAVFFYKNFAHSYFLEKRDCS